MWAIILHGGAKDIEPEEAEANRAGCLKALEAGRALLQNGGSAVDAVEAAIRVLEDDPTFNCGYGSDLNEDGEVEMCSAIMEGGEYNVGGVTVIQGVRHPISVAKAMLQEKTVLLAGRGARRFAAEKNLELCDPEQTKAPDQRKPSKKTGTHDTVGCVALDQNGLVATGTSTGGLDDVRAGRVGDSPQCGCGFYADNSVGAVVFSGDGEEIARMMLAARVMQALETSAPDDALQKGIDRVAGLGGEAGGIALMPDGRFGWMHNSREFAVAFASSSEPTPHVFLRKEEERQ